VEVVEGRGSERKRCFRRPFLQNPYLWLIDNEFKCVGTLSGM